eukprot:scaffold200866_cov40-Prasinocladus_malaysianus.AAC.1
MPLANSQVLGDRSMMVKYLNRNTLFVAVGSSNSMDEDSELTVHVIDTASGRHLFRQTHKARPPSIDFCAQRSVLRIVYRMPVVSGVQLNAYHRVFRILNGMRMVVAV